MSKYKFPLTMHIPPERAEQVSLALPNDQWRRLRDKSIDVVFNTREQLEVCIAVTSFLRHYEQNHIKQEE